MPYSKTTAKGYSKSQFGSVTILVSHPSKGEIKRNIQEGQAALSRIKEKLLKPGVKLRVRKDVPLFSVDPQNPTLLIRKLNGKTEKGVLLKNGRFEACG